MSVEQNHSLLGLSVELPHYISASSRRIPLVLGSLVLALGTAFAIMQSPRIEPLRESPTASLDWWSHPIERNAVQRLAVSNAPLHAVYALRGTDDVWFAGEGGLVVHSPDGGRTWQWDTLSAVSQVEAAPKAVRGAVMQRRRALTIPVAFASNEEDAPQQKQQPYPNQQRAPNQAVVPQLTGLTAPVAEKTLMGAGLRLGRTIATPSARDAKGVVTSQQPRAGSSVSAGTPVNLVLSSGPPPVTQTRPDTAATVTKRVDSAVTLAPSSQSFYPRFYDICFTPAKIGWVVGDRGAVFRSPDGGRTWTQVATGTRSDLNHVACDPKLGAIVAGLSAVLWLRGDSAVAELRSSAGVEGTIALTRGGVLWASGNLTRAGVALVSSADTGRTWDSYPNISRALSGSFALAFADSLNGFAFERDKGVRATRDGGKTWASPTGCAFRVGSDSVRRGLQSMIASTPTIANALDSDGRVWTTSDAWQTCERLGALRGSSVRMAAGSGDVWYATAGSALRSNDKGRTWYSQISGSRFSLIHFRDSLNGWASLENGTIGRTTDGGRRWRFSRVDSLDAINLVHFAARSAQEVFGLTSEGQQYRSTDGGMSWQPLVDGDTTVLRLVFVDSLTGWGVKLMDKSTYVTHDGGQSWRVSPAERAMSALSENSGGLSGSTISFVRAGTHIAATWAITDKDHKLIGFNGTRWDTLASGLRSASAVSPTFAYGLDTLGNLIRSTNGGRQWSAVPVNAPRKYPAPWYYGFAALTVGATLAGSRARRRKEESNAEDSIADILVSDRPLREGDRDVLDFGRIAAGLSRFIRNSRTEPPLTIAITGPWGTGKSSLMQLLRRDLQRRRFRTIWFNAWHHQREESLLASLLESIRLTATPPVWTPKGIRFRVRLLKGRISRYSAPALALVPIFALALGYILKEPAKRWHDVDALFSSLVGIFSQAGEGATAASGSTDVSQHKTLIALIISIVGTTLTYMKGLKAFGVKADDVARSVMSAGRVKTIESQPAFRYRFAQDFSEVTEALKPERIVIFIDDLDRCKPDQVLEILESINFLAESGDCVVVLGIDRERVTGCVAIGFKDVATVLAETREKPVVTATTAAKLDIGAPPPPRKTDIQYQLEYATHYLEKLLNMEIPIPPATPEGLGDVMTNTAPDRVDGEGNALDNEDEGREKSRRRIRSWVYSGVALMLTVATFLVGWNGSDWLLRLSDQNAVSAPAVVAQRPPTSAAADSTPAVPRDSVRTAPVVDASDRDPMPLTVGAVPTTAWWVHGLLALVAFAVLLWLLTPREDNRVEDSKAFADALRAWAPVLFEEHRTPRSAKKFLNKMRFLSMAQRAPADRQSPVEAVVARLSDVPWLRKLLGAFERRPATQEVLLPGSIPEVALVSLNVIRDRYPEWLEDNAFWHADLRLYVKQRVNPIPPDIEKALRALDEIKTPEGGAIQSIRFHRAAWSRLEVWVRD